MPGLSGRAFVCAGILPFRINPHINPHTWGRHLPTSILILWSEKNECSYLRLYPQRGKCGRHRMTERQASTRAHEDQDEPGLYEIRIKGHLDDRWAASFGGLTFTLEENGDTLITGPVVDQ